MSESDYLPRLETLIKYLRKNGSLKSPAVEQAFRAIPRHIFLPDEPLDRAYSDIAIAVRKDADNQWTSSSSQPSIMAIMLEQLDLRPGMRILEIGAGSGYNAALMGVLTGPSGQVVSIDIQPDLVEAVNQTLARLGLGWVEAITGDGGYGYANLAPYDRILLTVGASLISPAWREQLREGGRLVLPLSVGKTQKSIAFEKQGDTLISLSISDCGFMPLQGAFAAAPPVITRLGNDPDFQFKATGDVPLPVDAAQLDAWLTGPFKDQPSGVKAQVFELWGGLFTWLSLVEPAWVQLLAENEAADQAQLPELLYMGSGQAFRSRVTALLVGADSAAALARPPGMRAPYIDWNSTDADNRAPEPSFELYIRSYGTGLAAANRLHEIVQSWGRSGKPGSHNMRIRAIPAEMDVTPAPGEFLVERPWTKFIVGFID